MFRIQRLSLSMLLVAACASDVEHAPLPQDTQTADDPAVAPVHLPDELRARALQHLSNAVELGIAPEWEGATLGEVTAIDRPDIAGTAYFEVAIVRAGEDAGYIVLATGDHDYPIVQWSSRGTRPSALLRERAAMAGRHISRVYRLDVDYVAETDDGARPAAEAATNVDDTMHLRDVGDPTWRATKASFAVDKGDYLAGLHASAALAWNERQVSTKEDAPHMFGNATSIPNYCQVNDSGSTPHYRQLRSYEPPSGRWYSSGCAATAWALMIGWADMQADEGDPKWAGLKGLYRQGGSSDPNAPDARAPYGFDWGIRIMTSAIADTLGTWGAPNASGESQGATEPWRMSRITDFLNAWGMGGSVIATTFDWGGGQFDSLRDRAVYHICSDQSPAVIGLGALSHYALGTETYTDGQTRSFYLNMGHGGYDDAWYSPGVFFAGTLAPQHAGPEGASATGMEVALATYGRNCGAREGNVTQHISNTCNNRSSCSYTVDHRVIGDPAVGCAKSYDVTYRCSAGDSTPRSASLSGEASGQTVTLSCPTINVTSATYGGNCGAASGNETAWARAVCNGRTQCHPTIDYRVIGDPVPGCAKNFVLQYQCAGGAVKTVSAAPEAGFGSQLSMTCP